MRVAVLVRVYGPLEPRDQLVGARVHRPAAPDNLLPARNADRKHRGAGRNTREPLRPPGADKQSRHLRPVPLEPGRIVGLRRGKRVKVAVAEDVDPVLDSSPEERLGPVDARVEQRDRDAAAVEPRQHDLRAMRSAACKLVLRQQLGRDRGGVSDPHRVNAGDLPLPLEERDGLRVECGGKAVDDPRVVVIDPHLDPVLSERGQDLLLRREGGRRPLPLLRVGRAAAGASDSLRERRRLEHDDHALTDVDPRPGAARKPAPGRRGRGERRLGRAGAAGPDEERQRAERDDADRRRTDHSSFTQNACGLLDSRLDGRPGEAGTSSRRRRKRRLRGLPGRR